FICDMPKPLKVRLPDYQEVERRIETAVLTRFGVAGLPPEVKRADIAMLAAEQRQLFANRDRWETTEGVEPAAITLLCWSPDEAYEGFLERAGELGLSAS